MKRTLKSLLLLLTALMVLLGLCITASAADPDAVITFQSYADGFDFGAGSSYTDTDLFSAFKGCMPGDTLIETIAIKNSATDCDYIKLYLKAVAHDEGTNPLTYQEPSKNPDSATQSGAVQRSETVATMKEFLSQLTMRIYNGENLIYSASPDQAGALADNVLLGTLTAGQTLNLRVELDVPLELGNKYANRVGEVDWVFLAECIEYEKLTVHKVWDDNNCPQRPDSLIVHLLCDGKRSERIVLNEGNKWTYTWDDLDDRYQWSVEEEVPSGYQLTTVTEDNKILLKNYKNYTPDDEEDEDSENLTVEKVWSDEDNKANIRPDSVSVTLYRGDRAVDKVTLSESNRWSYTWTDLDSKYDWSVLETGIPKGYTPEYSTRGDVVIITNTANLIQTGQLSWPIPVLCGLGVLLLALGILMLRRKKKNGV